MKKSEIKMWFGLVLLVSLTLAITGCSERKETKASKNLSIHKAEQLLCRRSYAAIQFRDMPDKEIDSIRNSNPSCYSDGDSILLKKMQEFGLVDKEYGLIRTMFKSNESKSFELISGKNKISCRIERPSDSTKYDLYNLVVLSGDEHAEIEIEGHYGMLNEDIKYLLLDIIPGGYKEVVILEEYYIMNGDNSDVYIYEIKNK